MLIHPWLKQAGDHSWHWSLLCQQTQDTTVMTVRVLRAGVWKIPTHFGTQQNVPLSTLAMKAAACFHRQHALAFPRFNPPEDLVGNLVCLLGTSHAFASASHQRQRWRQWQGQQSPSDNLILAAEQKTVGGGEICTRSIWAGIPLPDSVSMRANIFTSEKGLKM